jgi:hypothetical protein
VAVDNRGYLYLTDADLLATMGLVLTKRGSTQSRSAAAEG